MATKKAPVAKKTVKKTASKPKVAAAKTAKTTKTKPVITEEDIRKKAEMIYNARLISGEEGTAESDWIQAEALLAKAKKK